MPSVRVVLYTNSHCVTCHEAEQWLRSREISLRVVSASKNEEGVSPFVREMSSLSVPILQVGDRLLVGLNPVKWLKALEGSYAPR